MVGGSCRSAQLEAWPEDGTRPPIRTIVQPKAMRERLDVIRNVLVAAWRATEKLD
jgi:hypothetical protein